MRFIDLEAQKEKEEDVIVASYFKEDNKETLKAANPSTNASKLGSFRARKASFSFFKSHDTHSDTNSQVSNGSSLNVPVAKEEKTLKRIARNIIQWAESASMGTGNNSLNNNPNNNYAVPTTVTTANNDTTRHKTRFHKSSESAPGNIKTQTNLDKSEASDGSAGDNQYLTTREYDNTKSAREVRIKRPNTVPNSLQQGKPDAIRVIQISDSNTKSHNEWTSFKKSYNSSNLKPNDNHLNRDQGGQVPVGTNSLEKFQEKDIQNYINERVSSFSVGHPSLFSLNLPACSFRSIMLTNFPTKTSLNSILAQVCGGPLERIQLFHKNNLQKPMRYNLGQEIDWNETYLQLRFWNDEDALSFMDYGCTGMFSVNGSHVLPSRYPFIYEQGDFDNDEVAMTEPHIKDKDGEGDEKSNSGGNGKVLTRKAVCDLMATEGARRVLVFKKPVKKVSNRDHSVAGTSKRKSYPSPGSQYSEDFDIEEVKRDFMKYGSLVDVNGVVSRKLCFAVHYMDVKDAIHVKRLCEKEDYASLDDLFNKETPAAEREMSMSMYEKYRDWYVWYGKDPVDKAALIID